MYGEYTVRVSGPSLVYQIHMCIHIVACMFVCNDYHSNCLNSNTGVSDDTQLTDVFFVLQFHPDSD